MSGKLYSYRFILFLSGLIISGCGSPNAPVLSELIFVRQAPENPAVLLFTINFEDANGDLGVGYTSFLLNNEETALAPLSNEALFIANNLPFDAKSGTLEFVVELTMDAESPSTKEEEFEFSVKMDDAEGYESNEVQLNLLLSFVED